VKSSIKTIKHNVFLQLSQEYPDLTLEQVDQVVDNYFLFFKQRVIDYDKLELRLLNLGTIVTKSRKLERCIRLQEKIIQEENGQKFSSDTRSAKTESALRNLERLRPLFETFNDIKQRGKTSRKKKRHVNQTQSDNSG
jgi:hypothetical protein